MSEAGKGDKTTKVVRRWRHWLPYLALGLVLTGLGVGYLIWSNQSVVDRQAIRQAPFTVYAPKSSPAGFAIIDEKTELSDDLLTYSFSNQAQDREIVVTVQPLPPSFDMQQLICSGTVSSTSTKNGMLYDLSTSGSGKFLLNTGDTLIFFTSSTTIDTATVNSLASDLVRHE